jgi:hypothetical protein
MRLPATGSDQNLQGNPQSIQSLEILSACGKTDPITSIEQPWGVDAAEQRHAAHADVICAGSRFGRSPLADGPRYGDPLPCADQRPFNPEHPGSFHFILSKLAWRVAGLY